MTQKKKDTAKYSSLTGIHRAVPIILIAFAVFTTFCYVTQGMGVLGPAISALFLGLFSYGAYVIPLLLVLHAIYYAYDISEKRVVARIIFSVIALTFISAFSHALTYWHNPPAFNVAEFFANGQSSVGGGFIGGVVGFSIIKVVGEIGLLIIALTVLAIYVSYFFAKGQRGISKALFNILKVIVFILAYIEIFIKKIFRKIKNAKSEKVKRNADQKNEELTDDEFFAVDNGMHKLSVSELGIKEIRSDANADGKTTLHEKVFHKSAVSKEEAEEMEMREKAEELFYAAAAAMDDEEETVVPQRRRLVNVSYDDPDSKIGKAYVAPEPEAEPTPEPIIIAESAPVKKDESADAIFTKSFDPFSMVMSEELASKPSSRSLLDEKPRRTRVSEDLSELTEAEIEREKRILEFERKKAAIVDSHRPIPVDNDGAFEGTQKTVDFTVKGDEHMNAKPEETATSSFVFDKTERTFTAPKAEPANYTAIGFGSEIGALKLDSDPNAFTSPETIYSHTSTPEVKVEVVVEPPKSTVSFTSPEPEVKPDFTATYTAPKSEPAPTYTPNFTTPASEPAPTYTPNFTTPKSEPTPTYTPNFTTPKSEPAPEYNPFSTPLKESVTAPTAPASEPAYTPFSTPEREAKPAYAPYVEEESTKLFEKKIPKTPFSIYTPAADPTPTVYENADEDETDGDTYSMEEDDIPSATYTSTKDDEPDEEYVPAFKPYKVATDEEISAPEVNVIKMDTEEEPKTPATTLKIEREYVGDDQAEEYEDETEEYTEAEPEYYEDEEEESVAFEEVAPEEDGSPFEEEEIPPEERNPVVQGYKDMFSALRDEPEEEPEEDEAPYGELVSPDEVVDEADNDYTEDIPEDDDEPPFEISRVRREPRAEAPKAEEKPEKKKPDFSSYKPPSLDLLGLDPAVDDDRSEINENTKILIDTLASFNVTASIKGVDRGPRITRYEVVPARGVKVNSITNLFNDIALNLAKEGIRMEAPIPGKSAIGFEIPNKRPQNVRLRELLECEEFDSAKSKTYVGIGKDVAGNPVFGDIAKYPHALICGATGMGKSVCINSIMISMLYKARPDEVKFIMIDPKKVEFRMYSGIPHLLIPVITEAKQAAGALMWAVEEMERRYELIEKNNVRNIEAYNEKVIFDTSLGEPLPKIVIVIDELADLMMQVRDPVEDLIMRIAQKARAAGIHLIIGTQRPSVQVITGAIKANIPSRISCKVTSQVDSRTIFDMAGAEKLLNRGDMLYWPVDKTKALRVQGAFVSDKEVEDIMEYLKSQVTESAYDDEVFAEINKAAQKCGNNKKSGVSADDIEDDGEECGYYSDQQFLDAVELAIRSKKVSTSLLQRKLSIGYGKAAKYIDAMEEIGIVSEPKGQKPRDVLLSLDEWHEKLSRVEF